MHASLFSNSEPNDGAQSQGADGWFFVARGGDRRASLRTPNAATVPVALFSCASNGAVIDYNEGAALLWGRHPDKSLPNQWDGALELLGVDGSALLKDELPAAVAFRTGQDVLGVETILLRPDGSARHVVAYAKAMRGADGDMREVFCALIDHTELTELMEAANRAVDDKNAFIAMLSHELRNPLSPILSAAIAMKKVANDSQVSKMAEIVERQAKRLARFVNDLLHAANLAQGGVTLNRMRAPLAEVMQAATDSLTALAEPRGQRVEMEPWPDAILLCDAERLSQAVSNVMANASEFTGRGGRIAARARVEGATLRIEIEDDGIGISPAHLDAIFKPYTHFATHAERTRAGAGLGLALARDICQKHGGSISASSEGPGRGSLFALSLPIVVDKPV